MRSKHRNEVITQTREALQRSLAQRHMAIGERTPLPRPPYSWAHFDSCSISRQKRRILVDPLEGMCVFVRLPDLPSRQTLLGVLFVDLF